jgi:hypothetical protein
MMNTDNTKATPELPGYQQPAKRIAMMYHLDYKGRIEHTVHVEYHTSSWGNYCSMGYITAEVYEVGQ